MSALMIFNGLFALPLEVAPFTSLTPKLAPQDLVPNARQTVGGTAYASTRWRATAWEAGSSGFTNTY